MTVSFGPNPVKASSYATCGECGFEWDWGDAQWHAHDSETGSPCPACLPSNIERGQVIRDDWTALQTLAYMLAGPDGAREFANYFDPGPPTSLSPTGRA